MKSFVAFSTVVATTFASTMPRAIASHVPQGLVKPGFIPTWIEEFNGTPDTIPSSANWIFDLGTSYPGGAKRWGNNEFQTYTKDPSNIHITEQQTLAITPQLKDGRWTSARIETQRSDFAAVEGGKLFIESKFKVGDAPEAVSQGIWPAWWALGSTFRGNNTNWPFATEMDFLEVINGKNKIYHTVHCGFAPGGPCKEYTGISSGPTPFTRGVCNTIGFQIDRSMNGNGNTTWADERMSWYMNGQLVFNVTGEVVGDEPAWIKIAHEPHFLLFNVAVGGSWPGPPNNQTLGGLGAGLEVDYVGVWNSL